MHDEWTDLMSAALDGELDQVSMRGLESHLAGCAECAAVYSDLRRLVMAAPGYRGDEPSADLWPGIKGRIEAGKVASLRPRVRTPLRFGLRELLAAGIVMAAGGAGGAWLMTHRPAQPVTAATPSVPATEGALFASAAYDSALAEMGQTLREHRGRLDTATVRVLEQSIRTIDQAVMEARAAIQRDSANGYLNQQIAANLRKKLNLLRAATRAINSET